MEDFEKLGQFYLGRQYDPSSGRLTDSLCMYDSKDLVTHGVCVGMTGSGKTGLCLGLLEEAAIDSIPALVIDPKGDMANLLLTFPGLSAQEFLPWINADDAARANQSVEQFAAVQAEAWKNGLAQWGQDGRRIQKLRESADFTVYTPGNTSGAAVSVLNSFACPAATILEDHEAMADLITSATSSLLGLIGMTADPISSREHILVSNIIQHDWRQGQDVDITSLILSIQNPPFERVGAFVTDSFFPAKERFEFALKMNNLLAAPGFSGWLEGEPLDITRLLHTRDGRPRVSVFSIAHLSDAERMFFVTLLLNQVVTWMRTQPGTTSLRALVYMDEVAGYLPPVADPPSKKPLLLLFRQARAFGVGILLATQNPVDLDYKALSNAGTWFVGRLQTQQDIDRLVRGMGAGTEESEEDLQKTIAALDKRVFLMKNIHENAPELFQTRWCLSYLRGPLTLVQIKTLMAVRRNAAAAVPEPAPPASPALSSDIVSKTRPSLLPQIPEFFQPLRGSKPQGALIAYKPMIYASGDVVFSGGQSLRQVFIADISDEIVAIDWDKAQAEEIEENELEKDPSGAADYAPLAVAASRPENYKSWSRDFADFLYRTARKDMYRSQEFRIDSKPGESEGDFRIRVSQLAREKRDRTMDGLRNKYGPKITLLAEKIRRAEQRVEKEKTDVQQAGIQTAISLGATLLGALMGRKAFSSGTIGRASTTMRTGMRTVKERSDIAIASENLDSLMQQKTDLETEFNMEMQSLEGSTDPSRQAIETVAERPKKSDVRVRLVALLWCPFWRTNSDIV